MSATASCREVIAGERGLAVAAAADGDGTAILFFTPKASAPCFGEDFIIAPLLAAAASGVAMSRDDKGVAIDAGDGLADDATWFEGMASLLWDTPGEDGGTRDGGGGEES